MRKSTIAILIILIFFNISVSAVNNTFDELLSLYTEKVSEQVIDAEEENKVDISALINAYSVFVSEEALNQTSELEYASSVPKISIVIPSFEESVPEEAKPTEDVVANYAEIKEVAADKSDKNSNTEVQISVSTGKTGVSAPSGIEKPEVKHDAVTQQEENTVILPPAAIEKNFQDNGISDLELDYDSSQQSIMEEEESSGQSVSDHKKKFSIDAFVLPSIGVIHEPILHGGNSGFGIGIGAGMKDIFEFGTSWSISLKCYFTVNPTLITSIDYRFHKFRFYFGLGLDYIVRHTSVRPVINMGAVYEFNNGFEVGLDYTMNNYKFLTNNLIFNNIALYVGKVFTL